MDDGGSPTKDTILNINNTTGGTTATHTHVERTANMAVSSNLAGLSDNEEDDQEVFDYGRIRMLRKIKSVEAEYMMGRVIGQGTYGQVREAVHIRFNMHCAIKVLCKEKLFTHQSRIDNLMSELLVLQTIIHSNLTHIYELLHDDKNFYIV